MNKAMLSAAMLLLPVAHSQADSLIESNHFLCATTRVSLCFENGECFAVMPWEVSVPEFLKIDMDGNAVSTTEASGTVRATKFQSSQRQNGQITLTGAEPGRAFSFVIHEATGLLTASVARDGYAISAFANCTAG